ncbi:MAG: metallophosphoesterase family protein [Candidatus Zixiibacteriota bacterium]
MKILVISDTHIGQRISSMPKFLAEILHDFDLIIHAGDIATYETLELFQTNENFVAVSGNMDDADIKHELPFSRILEIEGFKIGIAHGWGPPENLAERIIDRYFSEKDLDVLVFGHTHHPEIKKKADLLILNPGSISGNRYSRSISYLTLEISEGELNPQIHKFDRKDVEFW